MEYMYAALLLHKAKQPINEANMRKVLTAAGAHADEGKIKAVVAALEGANIEDIIAKASAVAAAPVAAAPAHGAAPAAEAKPHKSEEDEKKKEEEAAAGLGALFG
jgi:large subunit ribosomal protein L12